MDKLRFAIKVAVGIALISIGVGLYAVQSYYVRLCASGFPTFPCGTYVWYDYIGIDLPLVLIGAALLAFALLALRRPPTDVGQRR